MTTEAQPKRRGRKPYETPLLVQTAVRIPPDLLAYYRSYGNTSEAMRAALEKYRVENPR